MGNDQHPGSQVLPVLFPSYHHGSISPQSLAAKHYSLLSTHTGLLVGIPKCHSVFSPPCLCLHCFLYPHVFSQFLHVESLSTFQGSGQKYLLHEVYPNSQMFLFCSPFNPLRPSQYSCCFNVVEAQQGFI